MNVGRSINPRGFSAATGATVVLHAEDRVQQAAGFGTHGHRDMEIMYYVIDGALEHKDSIGTGSVIRPGDVQIMSAGTGIRHSEYHHASVEPVHFLQIWLVPDRQDIKPRYDQKTFTVALYANGAPDTIRTCDLCLRRATLYPAELRVQAVSGPDCRRAAILRAL